MWDAAGRGMGEYEGGGMVVRVWGGGRWGIVVVSLCWGYVLGEREVTTLENIQGRFLIFLSRSAFPREFWIGG